MANDSRKAILAVLIVVALIAIPAIAIITLNSSGDNDGIGNVAADALGRQVVVESHEKIVSCAPDITEAIYAMGMGQNLVGVTTYCDYPQDIVDRKNAETVRTIGGYWNPSIEDIVDLQPDLVFINSGVETQVELVSQLENLNITSVALYPGKDLSEVYSNIRMMGQVFEKEDVAEDIISEMSSKLGKIESITSMHTLKPKILFSVWLDPLFTTGGETYVDEIMTMAGGVNIFGHLTGWPQPSMEQVIAVAPDYIIVSGTMMLQSPEEIIESLERDPFWSATPAVQKGNVYVLTGQAENCFLRQGVRMVDAVHLLAEILFPHDFGADVPNVIGSEYEDYLEPLPDFAQGGLVANMPLAMVRE